jgi:hypothetical protein
MRGFFWGPHALPRVAIGAIADRRGERQHSLCLIGQGLRGRGAAKGTRGACAAKSTFRQRAQNQIAEPVWMRDALTIRSQ